MTEEQRFRLGLERLRDLLREFAVAGLGHGDVMLIGGQVPALRLFQSTGIGTIRVETRTGIAIDRGYSMEPDLLIDIERLSDPDIPFQVLRHLGYERVRTFRWRLRDGDVDVFVDLLAPAEAQVVGPTGMAAVPRGGDVLAKAEVLTVELDRGPLRVHVPDATGFLLSKLLAKEHLRPAGTQDCFDIYAYVASSDLQTIATHLRDAGVRGRSVADHLQRLFCDIRAPGVVDAIAQAGTVDTALQELLARAITDTFVSLIDRVNRES